MTNRKRYQPYRDQHRLPIDVDAHPRLIHRLRYQLDKDLRRHRQSLGQRSSNQILNGMIPIQFTRDWDEPIKGTMDYLLIEGEEAPIPCYRITDPASREGRIKMGKMRRRLERYPLTPPKWANDPTWPHPLWEIDYPPMIAAIFRYAERHGMVDEIVDRYKPGRAAGWKSRQGLPEIKRQKAGEGARYALDKKYRAIHPSLIELENEVQMQRAWKQLRRVLKR